MIDGVRIKQLTVHRDIPDTDSASELGYLMEIVREDDALLSHFGQSTMTVAYKGTIKAFHWHKKQDDLWFIASGTARIVLYDAREDSKTKGETHVITAGDNDYKVVLIPRGVGHGYQVLSEEPVILFYHSTLQYSPSDPDEERIPHDDPGINFDWGQK